VVGVGWNRDEEWQNNKRPATQRKVRRQPRKRGCRKDSEEKGNSGKCSDKHTRRINEVRHGCESEGFAGMEKKTPRGENRLMLENLVKKGGLQEEFLKGKGPFRGMGNV